MIARISARPNCHGGTTHIDEFGWRLDDAQGSHHVGGIDELTPAVERLAHPDVVGRGQPVGYEFDAATAALQSFFIEQRFEIPSRVRRLGVIPAANVPNRGPLPV